MKKNLTLIFLFSVTINYGQFDTLNSVPFFTLNPGHYQKHYESGKLLLEGNYERADSIECINCFENSFNKVISKANSILMRVGQWKVYHENGKLKAVGTYKGILETIVVRWPKDYGKQEQSFFVPGDLHMEYVKDNIWMYYNESGELIREEYYYKGALVNLQLYNR